MSPYTTEDVIEAISARGLMGLVEMVAVRFAVSVRDIAGRGRSKSVVAARHACWLALWEVHRKSTPEIGRIWDVDHSTVRGGIAAARKRLSERGEVRDAA